MEDNTSFDDFITEYKTKFAEIYGYPFEGHISRIQIKQAEGRICRVPDNVTRKRFHKKK